MITVTVNLSYHPSLGITCGVLLSQPGAEAEEQMPVQSQMFDPISSDIRREVDQRTTSLPPVTSMVLYLFMYVCMCYIWCIMCMTVSWCTILLIEHGGRAWCVGQLIVVIMLFCYSSSRTGATYIT